MTKVKNSEECCCSELERVKTENTRLLEELKRSQTYEARFNLLTDSSHEWIWEVDANGIYTYASPQVERVFGYRPEEIIGKSPFDIMPSEEAQRVGKIFSNIIRMKLPFSKLDNRCLHKDGHVLDVETSGTPIFDEEGELTGYRGIDHDRTKEKRYEHMLQKQNEELEWQNDLLAGIVEQKTDLQLLNLKLEQRVAEEVEKNRQKEMLSFHQNKLLQMGEMISMIAHQWRQPLAAITARASHLQLKASLDTMDVPLVSEASLFIQEQCSHMSQTIETFMNFSRPDQQMTQFDLQQVIDTVLKIIRAELAYKEISVSVDNRIDGDIAVTGVKSLLEQVLLNLLVNAKDAFEESEGVEKSIVIAICDNEECKLSIQDNAGGIPQELQEKIFNPYFTTKGPGKGTGIGLYMSQEIMQRHFGGRLAFIPVAGGSRFELSF